MSREVPSDNISEESAQVPEKIAKEQVLGDQSKKELLREQFRKEDETQHKQVDDQIGRMEQEFEKWKERVGDEVYYNEDVWRITAVNLPQSRTTEEFDETRWNESLQARGKLPIDKEIKKITSRGSITITRPHVPGEDIKEEGTIPLSEDVPPSALRELTPVLREKAEARYTQIYKLKRKMEEEGAKIVGRAMAAGL